MGTRNQKRFRTKYLPVAEGERLGIGRFPNFDASGSISGMKKLYYGESAKLVRCGSYIYNVTGSVEGEKTYNTAK